MRLPWFHDRRREIAAEPFPDAWRGVLRRDVAHYALLTPGERLRLELDLRVFRAEKEWEGGNDLDVTDAMQVVIGALACLLTLGAADHDYYPNVSSIIVYAGGYRAPSFGQAYGGLSAPQSRDLLGEAHADAGPLLISWADALHGARALGGGSVALHEFAHKLDFRGGGAADGVPRLHTHAEYDRWSAALSDAYARLSRDVAAGQPSTLDPYGATNAAEFFAVATEAYFCRPVELRAGEPRLYDALLGFYGIDWAERLAPAGEQAL